MKSRTRKYFAARKIQSTINRLKKIVSSGADLNDYNGPVIIEAKGRIVGFNK